MWHHLSRASQTRAKPPRAFATSAILRAALAAVTVAVLAGCGVTFKPGAGSNNNVAIQLAISPKSATLPVGGTQQFTATVSGTDNQGVTWRLRSSASPATAIGAITPGGLYTAPGSITGSTTLEVTATSDADPAQQAAITVTVLPGGIVVTPSQATLPAGASLTMAASVTGLASNQVTWSVNGIVGGSSAFGHISQQGVYVAPLIDPGTAITVTAASAVYNSFSGAATLQIVDPATPPLEGVSYAGTEASWSALALPWIDSLVGLTWDPVARVWNVDPLWQMPSEGVGPSVYFLEEALRPATRLAIASQDVPLMEELALFHLALLQQRATTLGAMEQSAQPGDVIFIDGPAAARTFAWYDPFPGGREIRESQLSNAQYLSTAAQLLRAIAEMPSATRTATLAQFATTYGPFLASEQLMRLLYGKTWWAHYQNPALGNPVVTAWQFLAAHPGYQPLPPNPQYSAAISDIELWLMMDTGEVVAADAAAPGFAILDANTRELLRNAAQAGTQAMQTRCSHKTAADGADVLSAFAGEWQDYPDFAYSAITTQQTPTQPGVQPGLSWDSSHAYRLPVVFRSLYETEWATGATYPARWDLVALGNTYVHLTLNMASGFPAFNNYLDGTDGWFQFDPADPTGGYPPYLYCDAMHKSNCLNVGAVQGWGELSPFNPDVAALGQKIINLAYDDSPAATAFKTQHYYVDGQYEVNDGVYPWLMMWVAADNAEQLVAPGAAPSL